MYIKLRSKKAFTLVEIMIVVAIIGLLIAIALPNFVKARNTARLNLCKNNMRLLGHGSEQYRIDEGLDEAVDVAIVDIADYLKGGTVTCPSGGAYSDPIADNVDCNYGAGETYSHGNYTVSTGVWAID